MPHLWEILADGKTVVSTTEESLWNQARDYFRWSDNNPIITELLITVGKDAGKALNKKTIRPYSVKGLCLYCGIMEDWLQEIKRAKKKDSLYYIVVSRIMYIIYEQNLSLAMTGVFNPIMAAKVLGMDTEDQTVGGPVTINVIQSLPPLSKSENEILEKLELEKGELVIKN